MSMRPQVYKGLYFNVETSIGTECVPADVIGRTCGTAAEAFLNYVEGDITDTDEVIECREGWLARLTMPGYLDCTDWTAHATEQAARAYLDAQYGD